MNYTKETKLSTIKNAETIANPTKSTIDYMLKNWTIGDFVKFNEKKNRNELKTESLSTLCGTSSGAIANRIDEQKSNDIYEKIGLFLGSWVKGGNKQNAAEIAKQAETNTKITMAKNMLLAKLNIEQIAKITGLSVDEINALNA
jgi:sulfite reductase beta subunit-like hemoprotein